MQTLQKTIKTHIYSNINNTIVTKTQTSTLKIEEVPNLKDFKLLHTDIILIILLFLFAIVAYVRVRGKNFIQRLSISILNYSYSDSFFNEKNVFLKIYGYLLTFVFFISFSLFVTEALEIFYPKLVKGTWFSGFFIILSFLVVLNILQYLVLNLLAYVFSVQKLTASHLFYSSNLLKLAGIVFLILIFAIFFTDFELKKNIVYLAISLSFLLYLLKIIKSIASFLQNGFSILYMFLYFCAVEILPFLLLVKILLLIIEQNINILNIFI